MRIWARKSLQESEYPVIIFLIFPLIIFGVNLSLDFFLPRLFITFYPSQAALKPLLLNSSFFGSFLTALGTFLYYRKRPETDNPEHYKRLLLFSLIISAVGMLFLSVLWYSGWVGFLITGRFLIGVGFTLLNIVIFPIILGTLDEKLHAFWFFFVTGFSAFGRFLAYPSSYFFFSSSNEFSYHPHALTIYYAVVAFLTLLIIFLSLKMPLKLGGIFKNPLAENPGAPHLSYEVITGILGLALMGFFEFFVTKRSDYLWSKSNPDLNLFTLVNSLAIISGGFMLGRFGASIKLSALPNQVKNSMLVILTAAVVFFVSLIITIMNASTNEIILNLLISIIFIFVLRVSRNNIFSVFTSVSISGFILTLITFIFLKDTDFENTALAGGGIFRAMSWPTLVYLTLYNYKHSLLSMSGLAAIAINSRFVFYLPDYLFNYNPELLEKAGYYILLFSYLYFIWVGINQQLRKEEKATGNFLSKK